MKITVFTPTYNRAHILCQAYESLKKQTNKDFLWLIIDDGSTDNTLDFINAWKNEGEINIQYIRQENAGKHVAHNTAVSNCKTDFLLILDSDDYLSKNAIEVLNKELKKIENNQEISGIIGNRYIPNKDEPIGTPMPIDILFASGLELYQKMGFKGDTMRLYKTKILKKYVFPVVDGEKFVYENVVFDVIDNKYKMLINRDKLYYCEYLEDGYTSNANRLKKENPIGYSLSLKSSAKYSVKNIEKIKYTILYIIWNRRYKINFENDIKISPIIKLIAIIFEMIKFPRFFYDL